MKIKLKLVKYVSLLIVLFVSTGYAPAVIANPCDTWKRKANEMRTIASRYETQAKYYNIMKSRTGNNQLSVGVQYYVDMSNKLYVTAVNYEQLERLCNQIRTRQ